MQKKIIKKRIIFKYKNTSELRFDDLKVANKLIF
jgi:hypothetical protein